MTLYDDILDLLDTVRRRDCQYYLLERVCPDFTPPLTELDWCESCRARELYARLVEARDRVEP